MRPGANAARGNRVHPSGAGPHQASHTPRHLTAVFRRGETCPEAGSKRVIHSDKAGALPLATGFPLETVQVRGQTDPYTQRKCDGAPRRRVGKGWPWELGHTRPTGCRGQARAESTADTEAEAREMASLPGRWMTCWCLLQQSSRIEDLTRATYPTGHNHWGRYYPPPLVMASMGYVYPHW